MTKTTPTNGSKPSTTSPNPHRPRRSRPRPPDDESQLLIARLPEQQQSLSEQLDKLKKSGYSIMSVTGAGKQLCVHLEKERKLRNRTFAPMMHVLNMMNELAETDESDETEGADNDAGPAEQPAEQQGDGGSSGMVDVTAPVSGA